MFIVPAGTSYGTVATIVTYG